MCSTQASLYNAYQFVLLFNIQLTYIQLPKYIVFFSPGSLQSSASIWQRILLSFFTQRIRRVTHINSYYLKKYNETENVINVKELYLTFFKRNAHKPKC